MERYKAYVIIVEGKKDVAALKHLGFKKVYAIHQIGVPIRERVEQLLPFINKKDKVCILTDLDKKGKQMYNLLKGLLPEFGVKLDSRLRGLLIKMKVSQVEGLDKVMEKIEKI